MTAIPAPERWRRIGPILEQAIELPPDWLGQAVAHGLARPDMIEKDSDLATLRGDPAFDASVARARKNAEELSSKPR